MEQIARTSKQLGAAIRRRRRLIGLTQQQLAEKIQLRQATVSVLEAGEPGAKISTVLDALTALNLEIVVRPRTQASPEDIEAVF